MCLIAVTCLHMDCCFSEQDNVSDCCDMSTHGLLFQCTIKIQLNVLAYFKVEIIIISSNVACSRHDTAEKLVTWHKTTINHSLTRTELT